MTTPQGGHHRNDHTHRVDYTYYDHTHRADFTHMPTPTGQTSHIRPDPQGRRHTYDHTHRADATYMTTHTGQTPDTWPHPQGRRHIYDHTYRADTTPTGQKQHIWTKIQGRRHRYDATHSPDITWVIWRTDVHYKPCDGNMLNTRTYLFKRNVKSLLTDAGDHIAPAHNS